MSDPTTLTLAFLSQEPGAAAGELQHLPRAEVVDLLEQQELNAAAQALADTMRGLAGAVGMATLLAGLI